MRHAAQRLLFREDGSRGYVGISAIDGLIAAVVAGPARIETDGLAARNLRRPHAGRSIGLNCVQALPGPRDHPRMRGRVLNRIWVGPRRLDANQLSSFRAKLTPIF